MMKLPDEITERIDSWKNQEEMKTKTHPCFAARFPAEDRESQKSGQAIDFRTYTTPSHHSK